MVRSFALIVALLAGLAQAAPAFAHASLLRTEPAGGTIVAPAPDVLKLVFNEPVSPLVFRLVDPCGGRATLQQVASESATVTIMLPVALGKGTHLLSWRVVSTDGHPVGGSFTFSVGERSAGAFAAPPSQSDLSVRIALWAIKLVLYAGLFVGIGGTLYRAFIARSQDLPACAHAIMLATLIAGALAAMTSIGLQGLDALARPFADIVTGEVWTSGLATSYRYTAEIATWAMIAGLFSTQAAGPLLARFLAAVALIAGGAALAASGHAGNAEPQWLTRTSVFVHAVCVSFWAGALVPLAASLRTGDAFLPELRRFSRAVPFCLAALIAAGIALTLVQVDRIDALWKTAYGIVLTCKLAALALLLGLAAWNRFRLTPKLEQGEAVGRRLAASIGAEIAIILVILALVALWRFTPPPRALAATAEPVFVHFHTNAAMAEFTLAPVRSRQAVTLHLLNGEFGPLDAKEVDFILSNPEAGIEPLRWRAAPLQGGAWRVDDVQVPFGGRWRARVEILVSDYERIAIEDAIELPR